MEKLTIQNVDPKSLAKNDYNTNIVSPANELKIEASLKRFGFFKPVLVRDTADGMEIVGGQHRWEAAVRMGLTSIPIISLGIIGDKTAKEISLTDNGRYGSDDTLQLAQLLETLGSPADLATFMPFDSHELEQIFSSVNIALDSLELDADQDAAPIVPPTRKVQEFSVMRFRVPMNDAGWVTELIEKTMKTNKLTDQDSLTNAGDALVLLLKELK